MFRSQRKCNLEKEKKLGGNKIKVQKEKMKIITYTSKVEKSKMLA